MGSPPPQMLLRLGRMSGDDPELFRRQKVDPVPLYRTGFHPNKEVAPVSVHFYGQPEDIDVKDSHAGHRPHLAEFPAQAVRLVDLRKIGFR